MLPIKEMQVLLISFSETVEIPMQKASTCPPSSQCRMGQKPEVAEILLEDGADVNAETDEGETPAMTAALRGEKELLEILFSLR